MIHIMQSIILKAYIIYNICSSNDIWVVFCTLFLEIDLLTKCIQELKSVCNITTKEWLKIINLENPLKLFKTNNN